MHKKVIRLTEDVLRRIVKESVHRILTEGSMAGFDRYAHDYDHAFANSDSIEDFDKRMKDRKDFVNIKANSALTRHPQAEPNARLNRGIKPNSSVNGWTYTAYGDKDMEKDAEEDMDFYGFK